MRSALMMESSPHYQWVSYGGETSFFQIKQLAKAPHLITNSNVTLLPNLEYYFGKSLPDSSYTIAPMQYTDLIKGLTKYYLQPCSHSTMNNLLNSIAKDFDIQIHPSQFQLEITQHFNKYLHSMNSAYSLCSKEKLKYDATHDPAGDLRKRTSCGYGFKVSRQEMITKFWDSVDAYYDSFDCSHSVNFTLFLKDEIREKGKETRSIAVPQFFLWIVFRKHLGWIYDYMKTDDHPFAYGHTPDEKFFTDHFYQFNVHETTHSIDFKKMDSRMNHLFIKWFENYILTQTDFPVEDIDILQWIHNESFLEKELVDPKGRIITFTNGELSGFPGTILYNCFYSLFMITISQIVHQRLANDIRIETIPLQILGDDITFQQLDIGVVERVAHLLGHELYIQTGSLINDITFLSYKFDYVDNFLRPYYANLDKMFASLRYYKNDIAYFQKIASFHSLLAFAPDGSLEKVWCDNLEKLCYKLLKHDYDNKYYEVREAFKPTKVWRNLRTYYSPTILGVQEWYDLLI